MTSYSKKQRELVGDLRQLAAVRRITLDDGVERGVRALAFSTGGGLDFWALADRALDIGPVWYKGVQIAWIGPNGFRSASLYDGESPHGEGFGRMLSGLVVTCGLDHIRQPAVTQPLHGRFPFTPANIRTYGEDWGAAVPVLYCEGEATQGLRGGPSLRLHRRIEAPISGTRLTITDTVENLGHEPVPQALLYHCNVGFPMIAHGSTVTSHGRMLLGPIGDPDPAARTVVESWKVDGPEGDCVVSSRLADGTTLDLRFKFDADTLPHLQLMHDLRPHSMIVAVEPVTTERLPGGASAPAPMLAPGEQRVHRMGIELVERGLQYSG